MDWSKILTTVYQVVSALLTCGILAVLWRIGVQLGIWKEWVRTTDKELSSQGTMVQQLTHDMAKLLGREEGRKERKD